MNFDPSVARVSGGMSDLPTDLKGACRAMEEEFTQLMLSTMRKAFLAENPKGSMGFSKDVTFSMFESQMAKLSSEGEGLGIWKSMYEQLSPKTEVKSEKSAAEKNDGGILRSMPHIIG